VNIKILACQIIGPAGAGSAGPVPTPLCYCNCLCWVLLTTFDLMPPCNKLQQCRSEKHFSQHWTRCRWFIHQYKFTLLFGPCVCLPLILLTRISYNYATLCRCTPWCCS